MNLSYLELVKEKILEVCNENGLAAVPLSADTHILRDTPLDSMGLAIVVTKLEDTIGKDPFAEGFVLFQTVRELAALYE